MNDDPQSYIGEERRRHWRFERRFSLDTLIAAAAILATVWGFATSILTELRANYTLLDKRVSILEYADAAKEKTDRRQDEAIRDGQQRVEGQLIDIQRTLREQRGAAPRQ